MIGLVALVWALGFVAFLLALDPPVDLRRTDAIVVPTGAAGRIDRGLALLRRHAARRLLVSGVAPEVRPADLAAQYPGSAVLFSCCVDLGRGAVDTRSNADETAGWLRDHDYRSVRLVTSDWHLARARMELANALDGKIVVVGDGVAGNPRIGLLVTEYDKLILRRIALWLGH